jgi:hypothetical protein
VIFLFFNIFRSSAIVARVPLQNFSNVSQFFEVEAAHKEEVSILLIPNSHQAFDSTKSLSDSALKCLVLFINFAEFLLAVILDDIADVNVGCLEEDLGLFGVGMISDLHLLALQLHLLWLGVLYFLLLGSCAWLTLFGLDAQPLILFPSHLLD